MSVQASDKLREDVLAAFERLDGMLLPGAAVERIMSISFHNGEGLRVTFATQDDHMFELLLIEDEAPRCRLIQ